MSKGKRKRERQERRALKADPAPAPAPAKEVEREERPNPYFWNGDTLMHRSGRAVAHVSEFPFASMREHYRRMEVIRSFHEGRPPYAPPKPKLVVP